MAKGQDRKSHRNVRDDDKRRDGGSQCHHDEGRPRGGRSDHAAAGARRVGTRAHERRHRSSRGASGRGRAGGAGTNGAPAYIEGRRACAEALDAGMPVRRALVAQNTTATDADRALARLVERLAAVGAEIELASRTRLDALSSHGAHQGIMLEVAPFAYATLDDVIAAAAHAESALVVVCDHVVDEGNLGAIVRSAEVVGAAGVVVARARAAGVGVGAYKTSAGAVLHVPIARVANIATAVERLKRAGFWAVAASEHAQASAWDAAVPLGGRVALVMGAEATGVSRLVLERCDAACRLPQRGRIESLNVAQAATVLCYEWLRRTIGSDNWAGDGGHAPAGRQNTHDTMRNVGDGGPHA